MLTLLTNGFAKIGRPIKYIAVSLILIGVLNLLQIPIFSTLDSAMQPETKIIVGKEKLKKGKAKEVYNELKNYKADYDNDVKAAKSGDSAAITRAADTTQQYNELIDENQKYKIGEYTELPKHLKYIKHEDFK